MKKIISTLLIICPLIIFGQTHSIDKKNMSMSGTPSLPDISINTFYNTYDTCEVSWTVIKDSMPSNWGVSFCFPTCYIEGVTSGQSTFNPNENIYLNCHMYPNGQSGEGYVQMQITTNNNFVDTVTWNGTISSVSTLNELVSSENKNIKNIYDLKGRKIKEFKSNNIYIIEFYDLTRKTIFKTI